MRLQSCFSRYVRYMLCCCGCSLLAIFVNSDMPVNKEGIQILSTVIFCLLAFVDSFNFARFLGKSRHIKYGVIYPYAVFILTVYLGHFLIPSARWRYLFLPFGILTNYGFSRLVSITVVHLVVILVSYICVYIGRRRFYSFK